MVQEPPLYVCHVAVEMAPICKVRPLGLLGLLRLLRRCRVLLDSNAQF